MNLPNLSKKKADAISNGVFLICLAILFYTGAWWPSILAALWATLATRQFLTGRLYDLFISTCILFGLFLFYYLNVNWSILIPILFTVGGIYIIFREYYYAESTGPEDEKNEEIEKEMEEKDNDK